jgi:hypothetical protein
VQAEADNIAAAAEATASAARIIIGVPAAVPRLSRTSSSVEPWHRLCAPAKQQLLPNAARDGLCTCAASMARPTHSSFLFITSNDSDWHQ